MNKNLKKIAEDACEHGNQAVKLLKLSKLVHEIERQGLIEEKDAAGVAIELNNQAIEELDKAIELQKEFISEQDGSE